MRPVDHLMGDDLLVGDQVLGAVAGFDRHVARTQRGHPTVSAADLNDIARLDGFVHQQQHATDQVGNDPLQAEAQADAERPAEQRQRGEVDAGTGQGYHHRQNDQSTLEQLAEQHPHRWGQVGQVLQAPLQRPRDQHRHPQHDAEIKHALEHAQQRQPQIADLDGQPVQEDQSRIEQVENRQHGDAVGGDHHRPRPHRLAHQHRKRADGDPGRQQVDSDPDPVTGPAEAHGDGTGDRQPGDPQQRKQQ